MNESPIANVTAECALLGGLMINNDLIDRAADILTEQDFYEPFNGFLFTNIVHQHNLGKLANPVTLKPIVEQHPALRDLGGVGFLAELTGSPAVVIGAIEMARDVAELGARRRFSEGLLAAAAGCEDFNKYDNISELAGLAEAAIADALRTEGGAQSMSAAKAIEANLDAQFEDAPGVMSSIIPSFDHAAGAICPGDLMVVAGRPGMGKTALAISYAHGVAEQGHGVTFASLEMRAAQLGGRLASDVLYDGERVPYRCISESRCTPEQRRAIARVSLRIREWPLWIEDLPTATLGRLGSIVRKHKRRLAARGKVLRLVVVDYLQLLSPDRPGKNIYEDISRVSRGLKALAKAENVGVMALCQLNREVDKRDGWRPRLSDLRDSGQIEQDADSIVFVVRQEEYLKRDEPDTNDTRDWADWRQEIEPYRGKIEFIIAKRRAGETGMARGLWDGAHQAVRG